MEHDVEAETEGDDEERVPDQEQQEGIQNLKYRMKLLELIITFQSYH